MCEEVYGEFWSRRLVCVVSGASLIMLPLVVLYACPSSVYVCIVQDSAESILYDILPIQDLHSDDLGALRTPLDVVFKGSFVFWDKKPKTCLALTTAFSMPFPLPSFVPR